MKKFLSMFAVLAFASCAQAADSYLYWMLNPVGEDLAFAYVRILGVDDVGNTSYLSVAPGGEGSDIIYNDHFDTDPFVGTSLASPYYTLLSGDIGWKNFYVELYNWEGAVLGVSGNAAYGDLVEQFIYADMGTSGTRTPYLFTASVPEPTGGLLMLFGFGLMALRRKRFL